MRPKGADMNKFTVGDIVICINTERLGAPGQEVSNLTLGKKYPIVDLNEFGVFIINDAGKREEFFDYRFRQLTFQEILTLNADKIKLEVVY